jgi:hypothetical protein
MSWLYNSDDSNPDALFNSDLDNDNDAISKPDPNNMPLLLENFYAIKKEMFNDIQVWLVLHYYAFQKGRSKPISKNCKKLLYQYDCAKLVLATNC